MGSISVACYKPRPGSEQALLDLVRNHLPPLRAEGLVTERWYETPANVAEFQNMFAHFEPLYSTPQT